MKILLPAAVGMAFWLGLPNLAVACSCAGPSDPCVAIDTADVVFVGRSAVIETGSADPANSRASRVRFDVEEVLHGRVPGRVELRNGDGGSCMYSFRAGHDYLVYAKYQEGVLYAFLCSRTGELADRKHDLAILRERRRGTPVPRLAGRIAEGRQRVDGSLGSDVLPLSGVPVSASRGTATLRTVTDKDGRFLFLNPPAGDYRVTAELPRVYDRVNGQGATVRLGCYAEVNIGVFRVPLRGKLLTADGRPESMPVTVHAFAVDGTPRRPAKERSTFTYLARDATWSLDRLPPGEYLVGVGVHFKGRWDPARVPFWYPGAARPEDAEVVRIGDTGVVELTLRHPAPPREVQFSGIMLNPDGTPASGGVVLHDLEADHGVANASADARGQFQVRWWEGRRYAVTAYNCQGRVPAMSERVPVDPGSSAPMRLVLTRPCPGRSP